MVRKPIVAGNWKMFKTGAEATAFVQETGQLMSSSSTDVEAVVCAPFTALPVLAKVVEGTPIRIGAQNMHWETSGAFTGEISGPMLTEWGASFVIIGHSERRQYFAETDETVNRKVHAAYKYGLIPIICVGESADERAAGRTKQVCRVQTEAALRGLTSDQAATVVLAYEPIWAIGTGKTPTAEEANDVTRYIRSVAADEFGVKAAAGIRILYGGSVTPANIRDYVSASDIDGALVGGASLEAASFAALLEGAKR